MQPCKPFGSIVFSFYLRMGKCMPLWQRPGHRKVAYKLTDWNTDKYVHKRLPTQVMAPPPCPFCQIWWRKNLSPGKSDCKPRMQETGFLHQLWSQRCIFQSQHLVCHTTSPKTWLHRTVHINHSSVDVLLSRWSNRFITRELRKPWN